MKTLTTIIILLLSNIALYTGISFLSNSDNHYVWDEFPAQIKQWKATEVQYNRNALAELKSDKIIYKTFVRSDYDTSITLFLSCYNSFDKADLSHSPIVCNTGQGWEIKDKQKKQVKVNSDGKKTIEVNQFIQKKLNDLVLTTYWYQSSENVFTIRGLQKCYLLLSRVFGKKDRNAFVRLTISISDEKNIGAISKQVDLFIRDIYPILSEYI